MFHFGANHQFDEKSLDQILSRAKPGDVLLMQNETNLVDYALRRAREQYGMITIFNPAPLPPSIGPIWPQRYPSSWLIMNSMEARLILKMSGIERDEREMESEWKSTLHSIHNITKADNLIITMGKAGCMALIMHGDRAQSYYIPALQANIIDTTGAGDTFLGYFFAGFLKGPKAYLSPSILNLHPSDDRIEFSLKLATTAAALSIMQHGALASIPDLSEVIRLYISNLSPQHAYTCSERLSKYPSTNLSN